MLAFLLGCILVMAGSDMAGSGRKGERMAFIGSGLFHSVVPQGETDEAIVMDEFLIDRFPVTNGEFMQFTRQYAEWQRDRVPRLFADDGYLSHWSSSSALGDDAKDNQPVTNVSWFAAIAYCESRNARLPSWYEWEYAAAADQNRPDAREDPLWRQQILSWYATPGNRKLAQVGSRPGNYYGVHDLHGLVWEWAEDYNALLVGADNREQGGADKLKFCGAGALTMQQKEQYAVLMRVAMLSSLEAAYTTRNLGFRCARDAARSEP